MTGKRVSTSTPESSEAPRESLAGIGLVERFDALREQAAGRYGAVEMMVTDRLNGIEHVTQHGKTEEQLMLDDALMTGNGFMLDGKRVDPALVRVASTKTSSPELASLAAKYVNMSDNDIWIAVTGQRELRYEDGDGPAICADIRSLAAAVLAQAEGTPRK